jgi:hypothetical protein
VHAEAGEKDRPEQEQLLEETDKTQVPGRGDQKIDRQPVDRPAVRPGRNAPVDAREMWVRNDTQIDRQYEPGRKHRACDEERKKAVGDR